MVSVDAHSNPRKQLFWSPSFRAEKQGSGEVGNAASGSEDNLCSWEMKQTPTQSEGRMCGKASPGSHPSLGYQEQKTQFPSEVGEPRQIYPPRTVLIHRGNAFCFLLPLSPILFPNGPLYHIIHLLTKHTYFTAQPHLASIHLFCCLHQGLPV